MEMNLVNLRKISEYRTPELNEVCYFHYKGFGVITETIKEYKACWCLWLEGNAIEEIENLETLTDMRQLYLQENCIRDIGNGLATLTKLVTLNLAQNFLGHLSGLSTLTSLRTLKLNGNRLSTVDKLRHLLDIPSLETVDLTDNKIDEEAVLPEIFAKMPNLLSLYAHQNPFCPKIKPYRKLMLGTCAKLRYLDDKPVFEDERRAVTAYMKGGIEAERAERQLVKDEAKAKDDRNRAAFRELIVTAKREKAERDAAGIPTEPTAFYKANYMNPSEEDKWFTAERERNRQRLQEVARMEKEIDLRLAAKEDNETGSSEDADKFATHNNASLNAAKEPKQEPKPAEAAAAHVDPMMGVAAQEDTPATEENASTSSYVEVAATPDTESAVMLEEASELRTSAAATPDCSLPEDTASSSNTSGSTEKLDSLEASEAMAHTGVGLDSTAHTSAALLPTSSLKTSAQHRPMIWGTPAYDKLWKQACAAGENENGNGQADDETVDTPVVAADKEPAAPPPAVEAEATHEELD
eukprot:TRINITY_DN8202_c0_g1_i1.p2 TRINITY_DN8202_c0_g1~~TRINITY_DN8202_c0_g1_i1.p2  ORF type:complete len:548 (+),score=226.75 TRINITY_DN8202_c0_g1_i1:70-1644(+)